MSRKMMREKKKKKRWNKIKKGKKKTGREQKILSALTKHMISVECGILVFLGSDISVDL